LRHREASGDIWIARWLQDGLQDLRFTARTMSKRPAFAIVAIGTLGLGIGGTTAVYSAVHAVLLAPLPYRDAGRVIVVWDRHRRDRESQPVATSTIMRLTGRPRNSSIALPPLRWFIPLSATRA